MARSRQGHDRVLRTLLLLLLLAATLFSVPTLPALPCRQVTSPGPSSCDDLDGEGACSRGPAWVSAQCTRA